MEEMTKEVKRQKRLERIAQAEIELQAFYVIREKRKAEFPRIMVCVTQFADGTVCRGVALCSFSERVNIVKRAIHMAKGRAVQAFVNEGHCNPILRERARDVLHVCGWPTMCESFKGQFNIEPTVKERELLDESRRRKNNDS